MEEHLPSEAPSVFPEIIKIPPAWEYHDFPDWKSSEKEDDARERIEEIRSENRFNLEKVGLDGALRDTMKYFQDHEFHFRDTRLGFQNFLTDKFPCGARPCDLIKRLRVCVHGESFIEMADWKYDPEADGEDAVAPDENFPWKEWLNFVYDEAFDEAKRLASIRFTNQPHLTIVLLLDWTMIPQAQSFWTKSALL
jgi:hypothetical protein